MSIDLPIATLRALVHLGERGSFTGAAESLGVAQSSVSRAVGQAEKAIGVRLFERSTRRVTPTEAGQGALQLARQIVAEHEAGMARLQGFLEGTAGTLRLSSLPSLAASLLPPFLRQFGQDFPGVTVTVDDSLSEAALDALVQGTVDLALVAPSRSLPAHLKTRRLARDEFFILVPKGHHLASASGATWSALGGERYIAFSQASSIRSRVDAALKRYEVEVEQVVEAQNVVTVGGLVAGGLGLSVVPAFVLPMLRFADAVPVPVTPRLTRPIHVVSDARRPVTAPVRAWLELLWSPETTRPDLMGVEWR